MNYIVGGLVGAGAVSAVNEGCTSYDKQAPQSVTSKADYKLFSHSNLKGINTQIRNADYSGIEKIIGNETSFQRAYEKMFSSVGEIDSFLNRKIRLKDSYGRLDTLTANDLAAITSYLASKHHIPNGIFIHNNIGTSELGSLLPESTLRTYLDKQKSGEKVRLVDKSNNIRYTPLTYPLELGSNVDEKFIEAITSGSWKFLSPIGRTDGSRRDYLPKSIILDGFEFNNQGDTLYTSIDGKQLVVERSGL